MTTLLAFFFMSSTPVSLFHYKVNHCYCDTSEFNARCIKIIKIEQKEYVYAVQTGRGYMGNFSNIKDTINDIYQVENSCEI